MKWSMILNTKAHFLANSLCTSSWKKMKMVNKIHRKTQETYTKLRCSLQAWKIRKQIIFHIIDFFSFFLFWILFMYNITWIYDHDIYNVIFCWDIVLLRRDTYIVLNSSRYSSSPLFSLIKRSSLSISSLSTRRKDPREAWKVTRFETS